MSNDQAQTPTGGSDENDQNKRKKNENKKNENNNIHQG